MISYNTFIGIRIIIVNGNKSKDPVKEDIMKEEPPKVNLHG